MLRIIDTETCGLQGGIVEIASVDVIDGKIVNPMSHLVRPDCIDSLEVRKKTGRTLDYSGFGGIRFSGACKPVGQILAVTS